MSALRRGLAFLLLAASSCRCEKPAGPERVAKHLSELGLYADIRSKRQAADVVRYVPAHAQWVDGLEATRWIALPKGSRIDTSDADHWKFPVGTRVFMELAASGKRIETRVIERIADGGSPEMDYRFSAYVWRDDESDADVAPDGRPNARGTGHAVPAGGECMGCHAGERGRILGFSALQLQEADGGRFLDGLPKSHPLPPKASWARPDDAATRAIGYLNANCGNCHNPEGMAWSMSSLNLRSPLLVGAAGDPVITTTRDVPLDRYRRAGYATRVVPHEPEKSMLLYRMTQRDVPDAMPPAFASKKVDARGVDLVRQWIESMR